jgi:hypothetical protein
MSDDEITQPSGQPAEKPTVKFEAPPKWAEGMFARVHEAINASEASTKAEIQDVRALQQEHGGKLDACISGLKTVNGELEDVKKEFHEFRGATNARLDSNSMRAKQESIHDAEQDDRIAKLSEPQMAQLLKAAAATPKGQKVVNALVIFVLTALGFGTIWLTMQTHKLQSPPVLEQHK